MEELKIIERLQDKVFRCNTKKYGIESSDLIVNNEKLLSLSLFDFPQTKLGYLCDMNYEIEAQKQRCANISVLKLAMNRVLLSSETRLV